MRLDYQILLKSHPPTLLAGSVTTPLYVNWIDNHSRVDDGVTVGSCKITIIFFADYLVLLVSS